MHLAFCWLWDRLRSSAGHTRSRFAGIPALFLIGSLVFPFVVAADSAEDWKREADLLREQNRVLQEQLKAQQQTLDKVNQRMEDLEKRVQTGEAAKSEPEGETDKSANKRFSLNNVVVSGEGGLAFFSGGRDSEFKRSEFKIDEARLFVESPILENIYFYSELNLTTRESYTENFQLGELYLDFENLSRFWNRDGQMTLRLGRFYIPFGEEYQTRYAIYNPLISHSLSDIWGVDEGIEVFGTIKKFSYAFAVQNGDNLLLEDSTSDKSVAGRIGFDPTSRVHLSLSAMRTGDIASTAPLSALWFANGFFMPMPHSTATLFHADVFEADAQYKWSNGYVRGAGGYAHYADNDPVERHRRDIYYYYIEAVQKLSRRFYAAGRVSQIVAPHGFPLVGNGEAADYEGELTKNLWRLSLGLGYRYSQHLVLKTDYSFEQGREQNGDARRHESVFGAEAAFQF
jgi:hypothetical protein